MASWSTTRRRARAWRRRLQARRPAEREREFAFYEVVDPLIATVTPDIEPWDAYRVAYAIKGAAEEWWSDAHSAGDVAQVWFDFTECFEVPQPHGMPSEEKVRDGMVQVAQEWLALAPEGRLRFWDRVTRNDEWWDWLLGPHAVPAPCSPSEVRVPQRRRFATFLRSQ
ncbi:MAG: hypothetical protein HGA44_06950 [Cellulomonadaceae bacterium]|nr:hypothetical protein [Cellulomonadaceae bacterium]